MRALTSIILSLIISACSDNTPNHQNNTHDGPGLNLDKIQLPQLLDCSREKNISLIAAHRAGPRPGYAENSISAMVSATKFGVVVFEIDVSETSDGALVLLHDKTLDRTTTGSGPLDEISLSDFKALSLIDETGQVLNESPPTLNEALEAIDGLGIAELDLKGVEPQKLIGAIREANASERVLIITYTLQQAVQIHQLAPDIMLSVGIKNRDDFEALLNAGMDMSRVLAWLGLGQGQPPLDQWLADQGVETSYGDFRGEDQAGFDYNQLKSAGGELLSIDHIVTASNQLKASQSLNRLLSSCPNAQSPQTRAP